MITMFSGMISNLSMMATNIDTKVTKIKGQKAIAEWNEQRQDGSIKILVADKVLITISGRHCEESDLYNYANAIDYSKIQSLVSG